MDEASDRGIAMDQNTEKQGLSWLGIIRLGLVQTSLGAIVVLMTTTLNRIMVVELALAATVPGALVALHYMVQMSRPRWGYGADVGGSRTPWIIGGMGVLALGGVLATLGTILMDGQVWLGAVLTTFAFVLIGVGVGASGTNLLALLATEVTERRRPAAASIVWIMMIMGFAVTAGTTGALLDPFSYDRLLTVVICVCVLAFVVSTLALWGVERSTRLARAPVREKPDFKAAFKQVWAEDKARNFTIFVFVSMLAYSAQDLILEPFAGIVFGFTPGESTSLGGVQHGGVLLGMIAVAIAGSAYGRGRFGSMRFWATFGCGASALAFVGLAVGAHVGTDWPLKANVFALGLANGAFAVAAIGSMMGLANSGREKREGTRMGLWGAAQAIAFGLGGFLGTVAVDVMRFLVASPASAYGAVFIGEAVLFVLSAVIAYQISPVAALGVGGVKKSNWSNNGSAVNGPDMPEAAE